MEAGVPCGVNLWDQTKIEVLLEGLKLAGTQGEFNLEEQGENTRDDADINADNVFTVSEKMQCSMCSVTFAGRSEQKEHYKSDWHRFNLKQRLKDLPAITEDTFEEITGDISSLSASSGDSSDEDISISLPPKSEESIAETEDDIQDRRHPKVFFQNANQELLSLYRCVLHGKQAPVASSSEYVPAALKLRDQKMWAMFMTGGGHFAGAIFNEGKVVAHKTFHRYTVRAKRGTAQDARDAQGNAPKSAGATLRRYNIAALTQDIQSLIATWDDQLKECSKIFLRAPGNNRMIFFGGKSAPFRRNDPRISFIPFATRRPTFKELQRVYHLLACITSYGQVEDILQYVPQKPQAKSNESKEETTPDAASTELPRSAGSSPLKKNREGKQRKQKQRQRDPDEDLLSSSSEDEGPMSLVEETLTTGDLKEFQATRKPRRAKKKKEKNEEAVKSSPHAQVDPFSEIKDTLYTACKMGDSEKLPGIFSKLEAGQPFLTQENSGKTVTMETPSKDCSVEGEAEDKAQESQPSLMKEDLNNSAEKKTHLQDCIVGEEIKTTDEPLASVLNTLVGAQQETFLHVAARSGHCGVISLLLEAGADPSVKNSKGQLPYNVSSQKEVRNEFRRFLARFPEKYDYASAQIPGPLTSEMEAEKKTREAERRKAQKKAKRERLKDVKAAQAQQQAEEAEKKRFLQLSDREKRALAAERRFVQQVQDTSGERPVLSRCWQCGGDLTGKVPFEYSDYKFCTTKCLRQHRETTTQK
ncbi:ankyrin repeat and zinc finger domain-containing protein 1-like isoform X2 [Lingula anatina]|uniref:Ankyrin repeat and zinc finger domain-containing protein 1-like isoform X2 n=1 Tax=Lingula anatina TaxID=7574 RepID=A0A1S3IMI7_LINAN|nr:ankyrin repeat and zinc finger domain-containing protein 1-like isoform X2 [Lingula anatina]|eukprot:XP_013399111.1 ankyrin repeat and zinc finger domain-containing protein 1-like isoform X2 [Lingula anatina]